MPILTRTLPEGRGQKKDRILRDESFQFRGTQLPKTDGWVVSTLPPYGSSAAVTFTANSLYLFYIGVLDKIHVLYEARIGCRTAVATHYAKAAIYRKEPGAEKEVKRIPSTQVDFGIGTTGQRVCKLATPTILVPNVHYFIGYGHSNATPAVSGRAVGSTALPISIVWWANALGTTRTNTMADTLVLGTQGGTSNSIPNIVYLSEEAARML